MTDPGAAPPDRPAYAPLRPAQPRFVAVRGLDYRVQTWGDPAAAAGGAEPPLLVMLHGWMDVGASFQFVVDALSALDATPRRIVAPDWRGFGRSSPTPADSYWFPDYLGDLDALLDVLQPDRPVDLVGHSMGGNVASMYAGVRPGRVRRLVNLEGYGLPDADPDSAPTRYAQWLDELKQTLPLRSYDGPAHVAARLRKTNPLLAPERADWLARQWAEPREDGQWHVLGDPAHQRVNPVLYRRAELIACWRRIAAPTLWIEGDQGGLPRVWGRRYPREDFEERLAVIPNLRREVLAGAGHMLHHDQPEALARLLADFLA